MGSVETSKKFSRSHNVHSLARGNERKTRLVLHRYL